MKKILIFVSTGIIALTGPAQTPVKKVLLEEFTTSLCGMCPPKSHEVNQFHQTNPTQSVMMSHHSGFGTDAMTNSIHTTVYNTFAPSTFGFAPAIMIDRAVYPWRDSVPYMSVNGFDSIATRVMNEPAPVGITLGGTYNPTTRSLTVTATATFVTNPGSEPLRLNIYLVEDSVIGSGSGYDQKCYDSQFANTYYPGQYNASTSYITGYPHRHVVRAALTSGVFGPTNIIPSNPTLNTPYSTTVNYTIPANYLDTRCYLVAYVAKHGSTKATKYVLNANDVKLSQLSTLGIKDPCQSQIHAIFPNPSHGNITLAFSLTHDAPTSIYICDVTGKIIKELQSELFLDYGKYEQTFSLEGVAPGLYFLRLLSGTEVVSRKLVLE